jgi:heterodisulfide reductase subunit B
MKYMYFPGCSLKSSGRLYELSLLAVLNKMNFTIHEIENWNCCGATTYMSINEDYAIEIASRNLALAEQQGGDEIIAPCAACYMGLLKTQNYITTDEAIRTRVHKELDKANLSGNLSIKIRHPLDLFVNIIGLEAVKQHVQAPLKGLKVASYYGCQLIRPFSTFDNVWDPQTLDLIVKTLGGEPMYWPLKTRCCSGSMTSTMPNIGSRMSFVILQNAKSRGADVIITACPLCQFNLECFQGKLSKEYKENVRMPVMYFTQLMGLAYGLSEKELGLNRMLSPTLSHS